MPRHYIRVADRPKPPIKLPNEGSAHQTPASLYIDTHYSHLQIAQRWTWKRYVRLCRLLKMTPYELASLVMLPHASIRAFQRFGVVPPKSSSTTLVLTILEAQVFGEVHHDVIKNPFPNLSCDDSPKIVSTESTSSPVNQVS